MTTIAITGVDGLLGRRLVPVLDRRDDVDRIVGLDLTTPEGLDASRFAFRPVDVRSAELADALHGVDVLVHLAFQLTPDPDEAAMRSVNVDGTVNTFEAAHRAGVGHVVHLSSVLAYGAHPDNDVPLTEDSPLRGTPGFHEAEQHRDIERWLAGWLPEHPGLDVAVLRPAVVLGAGVHNLATRLLESPRLVVVRGHAPPLQFVHVGDVVSAIVHAIDRRLTGPYNVCAEGWLSLDEVAGIAGKRTLEVPEEVAYSTAHRLWELGVSDLPPGVVAHLVHPWVMSPDRLIGTGWHPRFSNRDALAEAAREHAAYLTVGRARAPRWLVRVGALVAAVAATIGVLAGVRRLARVLRAPIVRLVRRLEAADDRAVPPAGTPDGPPDPQVPGS